MVGGWIAQSGDAVVSDAITHGPTANWKADQVGEAYEQFAARPWYREVLRILIQKSGISGGKIVDTACGTGAGTRALAEFLGPQCSIVGIDSSGPMLAYAKRVSQGQDQIRYLAADVHELSVLIPGQCRAVTCFNALPLLKNLPGFYSTVASTLAPQGTFVACTGFAMDAMEFPQWMRMGQVLQAIHDRAKAEYTSHFEPDSVFSPLDSVSLLSRDEQIGSLAKCGLEEVICNEMYPVTLTRDDLATFLLLPGVGTPVLPDTIPLPERRQILTSVFDQTGFINCEQKWWLLAVKKAA